MTPELASNLAAPESFTCKLSSDGSVEVSPLDTRDYRYLCLDNQLKVLLVSDSLSDKAAASLDVSVGHFSDPWDLPGLAHFCEHMLFLGTEKYPDEGSYRDFLSQNSGYSNAYTSKENTNYHFQLVVPPNDLKPNDESHMPRFKEALDRFSQFFIAPLFTESATERELNAVDSEHQKNLQRDGNRLYQLQKSQANPEHPFSKFSTGSKATLGSGAAAKNLDTREQLLAFHKKHYSANLMHLCLAGPYSLDVLEQWTRELFSPIKNSDAEHPSKDYMCIEPLLSCHTGLKTYVDPIKDIRQLEVYWVIPPPELSYKTKPTDYISHLLGHEGKGSLLSVLKERHWANGLGAGPCNGACPFAFFSVIIHLTEEGVNHVDSIIELLFGYLHLIKSEGIEKWIFEETCSLSKMNFHFQERCEPYSFVQEVSSTMEKYPPIHYLSGPYLVREFDREGIQEVLDLLTPERCCVRVCAKAVKGKTNLKEKWYQTPYGVEQVSEEQMDVWKNTKPNSELGIPPKNEFIPSDFTILADPIPHGQQDLEGPEILEVNEFYELHYKLDKTFNRPKAVVYLDLKTNWSYMSPRHSVLTKLATNLLVDELTEFSYDADIAGLHYDLSNTQSGISLMVQGYNHKLRILLETILKRIKDFTIKEERFPLILDSVKRSFYNFDKEQPYQHAMYAVSCLLEHPRWHVREYIDVVENGEITMDVINAFVPELLRRMFAVGLIGGNVSEQWAKDVMNCMKDTLKYKPLAQSEFSTKRVTQIPLDYEVLSRQTHPNVQDNNSAISVTFQLGGSGDTKKDVLIDLLSEILSKPTFHELRTVQQLGYMVFQGFQTVHDIRVIYFIIQSTVVGADELMKRIRQFLVDFRTDNLEKLTDEELKNYVDSLSALKAEPEKKLVRRYSRFWHEICERTFEYQRAQDEIEALKSVTKEDVIKVFDEFLADSGSQRRCLISLVHGNQDPAPSMDCVPEQGTKLEGASRPVLEVRNCTAFKDWCPTYPALGASMADIAKRNEKWC